MEALVINKKKADILEASRQLFWKHGFRRVTIEEICNVAGTSKMTFYRYFPDKINLAKKVLDQFYEQSMAKFRIIVREDTSAAEKMEKMISMKLEGSNDISNEFIQDFLGSTDLGLTSYFEDKINLVWAEGISEFKLGQKEGWIRKDLNVEFLFYFSQKIVPLLTDKQLMKLFDSPKNMISEVSNLIVYGIVPRE